MSDGEGPLTLKVRVIPRASRSEIVGMHDGMLKVRLTSPPIDGAANEELIKLLAKALNVSKGDIQIIMGHTTKSKCLRIYNVSQTVIDRIIK